MFVARYGHHHGSTRVTGCQFDATGKQLLVTTNDSNIRLINMEDFTIAMKFKGQYLSPSIAGASVVVFSLMLVDLMHRHYQQEHRDHSRLFLRR